MMERSDYNLSSLFAQLGKSSNEGAMGAFIESHGPLPEGIRLHEAPFWNASQAAFLAESVSEDADWAQAVESLNTLLHAPH